MFFPFKDDNPHTTTPYVTWIIIVVCAIVYVWQLTLGPDQGQKAAYIFGLLPGHLFGTVQIDPRLTVLPGWMTVFTSMFMHGGFLHLGGNMLYLWIFGDNVEASLGHVKFLLFYLLCGAAAALVQSVAAPTSTVPMVGASGAIAAVLGAYLILHPRANVRVFVWVIIFVTIINLPAWLVLGFWFLGQLWSAVGADPGSPGVAFLAHIGGFVAGVILVFKMRRPTVPVFDQAHSRPFEVRKVPVRRRPRGSVPSTSSRRFRGSESGQNRPWD